MLKWFNRKKKDNKGFSLVELVIVVAILAILVGILAPQYTKYVERSRKAADASNLDNFVTAVKVAAADDVYSDLIPAGTTTTVVTISIDPDGTTVKLDSTAITSDATGLTGASAALQTALNEYAGANWGDTALKSKAWVATTTGVTNPVIIAKCTIESTGSVSVVYDPDIKTVSTTD